jgi:hypothetical protein
MQENHDVSHCLLLFPGCHDPRFSNLSNTVYIKKALWIVLDYIEHFYIESSYQLRGEVRANTFYEPRPEVSLDAISCVRIGCAQDFCPELLPVPGIDGPAPSSIYLLSCRNDWQGSDYCHQISVAADLDLQHSEARLWAVECYPFNDAGDVSQMLLLGRDVC